MGCMYDVSSSITAFKEREVSMKGVACAGKMVLTMACVSLLLMCAVHCGTAQLQAPVQGPSSEVMTSRREIDVAFICSQGCC